jgi:hypothetical protein
MSRSTLGRLLAGFLLAVTLAFGSVSTASASDASLKQTIKKLDRTFEKKTAAISFPEDEGSPTFAKDYAAATAKFDRLLVSYRNGVAKEHGSTGKGRQARKLMIASANGLRAWLKTLTGIVTRTPAGQDPSAEDQAKLKEATKGFKQAAKDNVRAYRLLGMKAPDSEIPGGDGTATV